MALRDLVDVLRTQLARAEALADEDRAQLQAEREWSAAAERQVVELRALVDNELTELRAQMDQACATLHGPDAAASMAAGTRRPLTQWLLRFLVQRRHRGTGRA